MKQYNFVFWALFGLYFIIAAHGNGSGGHAFAACLCGMMAVRKEVKP